jgi:hypothetical protein
MSGAMDETDNVLWNGSEKGGKEYQECEEDEGTDHDSRDSDTDWSRWIECDMLCVLSV